MAIEAARPVCADHPEGPVVGRGRDSNARRRRWKCLGGGKAHAPRTATREDLLGVCLGCDRHWEHGYPIAVGAWFLIGQVVAFLGSVASGRAVGPSMRIARAARNSVLIRRARMAGLPAPAFPPPLAVRNWSIPRHNIVSRRNVRPEEDGRTGADWLGRYGAPLVAAMLDRQWPDAPVLVDSTKFQSSAVYPPGHARSGQPKRGGSTAFNVMAAGARAGWGVPHHPRPGRARRERDELGGLLPQPARAPERDPRAPVAAHRPSGEPGVARNHDPALNVARVGLPPPRLQQGALVSGDQPDGR